MKLSGLNIYMLVWTKFSVNIRYMMECNTTQVSVTFVQRFRFHQIGSLLMIQLSIDTSNVHKLNSCTKPETEPRPC